VTALPLRIRIFGRLLAASSVAKLDEAGLLKVQHRKVPHNALTDRIFGSLASGVDVQDGVVAGAEGTLAVRAYYPAASAGDDLPVVVNFHGGGFCLGSLDQSDWICSRVALGANVAVVSVDYRLAPAHRFPAAVEDCYAALCDVVARATEFGIDPQRVAVMGDSAGGNLSAVVALLARDRSGPKPAFQVLLYPVTDQTNSSPSVRENRNAPILTEADIRAFARHYLADHDPKDPRVSPLFAETHRDLPPALIQVAEHDPIRDDGVRYAEALRAAGVPVKLTTYDGMPHGYLAFPGVCRSARPALAEICRELRTAFAEGYPSAT
jgi:acetyl esterase